MKRHPSRNPYDNTSKRRAALAWMATRGITQPRGTVRAAELAEVQLVPVRTPPAPNAGNILQLSTRGRP